MYEAFCVKVGERIQRRMEHLTRFILRERPVRNDLRQILVRVLHHGEKKLCVADLAMSRLKYSNQVGMRQGRGEMPRR
jgi:hypothetical protein